MARKETKKRYKLKFKFVFFALSLCTYLFTRTFLTARNASLSKQYQENQEKILQLTKEAETLKLDVQNLSTYDRIKMVTDNSDMSLNQNNVVNIIGN